MRHSEIRASDEPGTVQLFIEELGWDNLASELEVDVDGASFPLEPVANKRGLVVFALAMPDGSPIPDRVARRRVEQQVGRVHHEHLIVFCDAARGWQIWQWVDRSHGRTRFLEHNYSSSQSGEALILRLKDVVFELDEEEKISLVDVTRRVRRGFDVERVTRAFFDEFKQEHGAFLELVTGIESLGDREWYASVMLNRLMFVYFIQKKGFLDGDVHYLRHRLERCQRDHGRDRFYSFYRHFLLRLFKEGLGSRARSDELDELLGDVPYLNGGLFEEHVVEKTYPDIQIPDQAFEAIFDLFDQYQWYLDDRPLRNDKEINPDVLGYIFEKFVNQKQMGAFYTREDITGYIIDGALLPSILDVIEEQAGHPVWQLLRSAPDRYLSEAISHGADQELPEGCPTGLTEAAATVLPADEPSPGLSLPGESWWEVLDRREWNALIRSQVEAGSPADPEEMLPLGVDLRLLAEDAITDLKSPFEVVKVYEGLRAISVLDPTVGSGAFLFAALRVFERTYTALINRAADLVASGNDTPSGDLGALIEEVEHHPSTEYFIKKVVLLENLFGVDIMEEAVEIARLRLFLALVAHLEDPTQIEPLPDIDLNLRSGNLLVGITRAGEAVDMFAGNILASGRLPQLIEVAAEVAAAYDLFVAGQRTGADPGDLASLKQEALAGYEALRGELDAFFHEASGTNLALDEWRETHQPFHWLAEFPGIMHKGGFSVLVGNPPYVAKNKVAYTVSGVRSQNCPDIFAPCIERAASLLAADGRFGMIVPISFQFSNDFEACREVMEELLPRRWASTYSRNPSALFTAGLGVRNTILVGRRGGGRSLQTTALRRWHEPYRPFLFATNRYSVVPSRSAGAKPWPRLGHPLLMELYDELTKTRTRLGDAVVRSGAPLGFKQTALYYVSLFVDQPPAWNDDGNRVEQTMMGVLRFLSAEDRDAAFALLAGRIGLWWWAATGDDFHITSQLLTSFPISLADLSSSVVSGLAEIGQRMRVEQPNHPLMTRYAGNDMGNFDMSRLRHLTDEADLLVLADLGLERYWPVLMLADARLAKVTGERPGTRREWPREWDRVLAGGSLG